MTHPPCQGIPDISTLPWFTLFTPYICLLVIRGTRDLVDDIVSGVREHLGRGRGPGQSPSLLPQGTGAPWLFGPVILVATLSDRWSLPSFCC